MGKFSEDIRYGTLVDCKNTVELTEENLMNLSEQMRSERGYYDEPIYKDKLTALLRNRYWAILDEDKNIVSVFAWPLELEEAAEISRYTYYQFKKTGKGKLVSRLDLLKRSLREESE